jgi:hypothetical protein
MFSKILGKIENTTAFITIKINFRLFRLSKLFQEGLFLQYLCTFHTLRSIWTMLIRSRGKIYFATDKGIRCAFNSVPCKSKCVTDQGYNWKTANQHRACHMPTALSQLKLDFECDVYEYK